MKRDAWVASSRPLIVVGVLAVLCFFLAIYLVSDHYSSSHSTVCNMASFFSCAEVNKSWFSEILGVPVAVFGAIYHLVVLGGIYKVLKGDRVALFTLALFVWGCLGVAFIFYMIAAEVIIGKLCPFCTLLHIFMAIMQYYITKLWMDLKVKPNLGQLFQIKAYVLIVIIVNLLPFFFFPISIPPSSASLLVDTNSSPSPQAEAQQQRDASSYLISLATCVTNNNVRMFGSDSCGVCRRQKALLGDGMPHIDYTDCSRGENAEVCRQYSIQAYPTWIKFGPDGQEIDRISKLLSEAELEDYSGCVNPPPLPTQPTSEPTVV